MSSGHKREIVNLRERVRSTDQNRLQAFVAADRAELVRALANLGNQVERPWEEGGPVLVGDIPTTVDTPLRGDIFEGLVVTPIVGSTSVHISPGVVGLMDPDGQAGSSVADPPSADDSPYKMVVEPTGVQTNGVLTIASNAGPGDRWDVIECRRSELVIETGVRDIFDPSTGTSSPQTVDKVGTARLEFRVRAGTAGAGFPGAVQGWLPLAAAFIAAGAGATTDDVDFWDVRPLAKDRIRPPWRTRQDYGPPMPEQRLLADDITNVAQTRIGGQVWGQINGVLAGGKISRGRPGTDLDYIDAQDAAYQEAGYAPGGTQEMYFLWVLFPFSLPRWCRYNRTPLSGLRFPKGMRGIPLISQTRPRTIEGSHGPPSASLTIPAFLDAGGGGLTLDAVCVAVGTTRGGGIEDSFAVDGEWTSLQTTTPALTPTNGTGAAQDEYDLLAGTHYPDNARALRVMALVQFTGVAGNDLNNNLFVDTALPGTNSKLATVHVDSKTLQFGAGGTIFMRATFEVPVHNSGMMAHLASGITSFVVDWNAAGFSTKSGESIQVIGWKLAD